MTPSAFRLVSRIRIPSCSRNSVAARAIREQSPGTRILVLSAYAEVEHAMELLASGNDQPVHETGIMIFRFVAGRVAETWFEGNDLEVTQQIGGRVLAGD